MAFYSKCFLLSFLERSTRVCHHSSWLDYILHNYQHILCYLIGPGVNVSLLPPNQAQEYKRRRDLFAANRTAHYYDDFLHRQKAIHFISDSENGYRLLEHFYSFIHFEDVEQEKYYKRFVRDFIHYVDLIFCKAALIINQILIDGGGSYSSFHIRR